LGLVTSAQRVPAQIKKKEKIGTIFCPKGGLAVNFTRVILIFSLGQVPNGPLAQSAVIYLIKKVFLNIDPERELLVALLWTT
jgi:hypothetical protein